MNGPGVPALNTLVNAKSNTCPTSISAGSKSSLSIGLSTPPVLSSAISLSVPNSGEVALLSFGVESSSACAKAFVAAVISALLTMLVPVKVGSTSNSICNDAKLPAEILAIVAVGVASQPFATFKAAATS